MAFSIEYRGYQIELFNSLSEEVLVKDSFGKYLKSFPDRVRAIEYIDKLECAKPVKLDCVICGDPAKVGYEYARLCNKHFPDSRTDGRSR